MSESQVYGSLGAMTVPLALGLLRLSTEGRPDRETAIAVIHRALDLGVRVLDTADSYALNDQDMHYGEKLARDAVAVWQGPRESVHIVTKVGMVRPKGRWLPNGRPDHLRRAVEGSLRALSVDRLDWLLLHGNDPSCPYEDSLGTLAELQRAGKVDQLGLCNVDLAEIRQAQRHFRVGLIQNELSVINRKSATEGTLALARELGIPFLAHRPLGGHAKVDTLEKNRAMKPIADRHGITKHTAALASLIDLGAPVLPLFGATCVASVEASVAALAVRLDEKDRAALADKISFEPNEQATRDLEPLQPSGRRFASSSEPSRAEDGPEVVVIMGIQGAGKSTLVERFLDAGYARLNRDLAGGSLDDLLPKLADALARGERVVLDNTYPTFVSRWGVLRVAHRAGAPARCIHLATGTSDALLNISLRLLQRYGALPGPDELKEWSKSDPNLPPPAALARYAACLEPPQADEGFAVTETVAFERRLPIGGSQRALFLDVDGTLRVTLSGEIYPRDPNDVRILPHRSDILRLWLDQGWQLFLVSNQSGIASGNVSEPDVRAAFTRTIEGLGVPIVDVAFCPHPAFPVGCFCRKPMPGMAVALAQKHGLDLARSVMVGDRDSDAQFAEAIGARYFDAETFFDPVQGHSIASTVAAAQES